MLCCLHIGVVVNVMSVCVSRVSLKLSDNDRMSGKRLNQPSIFPYWTTFQSSIITFCKRWFGENSKDPASGFLKNWSVLFYKCHLTKVLSTLSYSVMNTMCFGSFKSGSVCPHALKAFCSSKKDAPLWEWYTSRSSPRSHDSIFIQHLLHG